MTAKKKPTAKKVTKKVTKPEEKEIKEAEQKEKVPSTHDLKKKKVPEMQSQPLNVQKHKR